MTRTLKITPDMQEILDRLEKGPLYPSAVGGRRNRRLGYGVFTKKNMQRLLDAGLVRLVAVPTINDDQLYRERRYILASQVERYVGPDGNRGPDAYTHFAGGADGKTLLCTGESVRPLAHETTTEVAKVRCPLCEAKLNETLDAQLRLQEQVRQAIEQAVVAGVDPNAVKDTIRQLVSKESD